MELSLFLAKLIGIYLLIVGALWIVRRDAMTGVIEELLASRPLMCLSGVIALVIGIAMAIGHSIWEPNWRGLITLIGYLSILKGITRIAFPDVPRRAAGKLVKSSAVWIWLGVILLMGAYLTWAGFTNG